MSLLWAVQVAAVQRWLAFAPLAELVGERVYDGEAPRDADGLLPPLPYIVIDAQTRGRFGTLGQRGGAVTITASAWAATKREVTAIVEQMDRALDEPVAIEGHGTARLKNEFTTVLRADDGSRQAPARYRITTLETR